MTIADMDKEEGLAIAKRFSNIGYGILATAGTAAFLNEHGIHVKTVKKISEDDETMC